MTVERNIARYIQNSAEPFDSDALSLLEEFYNGWIECSNWQDPILKQLRERMHYGAMSSKSGDAMPGGKPKSKPPVDVALMDLYHDCCSEATIVALHNERDLSRLQSLRLNVRRLLGYETPVMILNDTSCHKCGGRLSTAQDASTDVSCTDPACGNVYRQGDWVDILLGSNGGGRSEFTTA